MISTVLTVVSVAVAACSIFIIFYLSKNNLNSSLKVDSGKSSFESRINDNYRNNYLSSSIFCYYDKTDNKFCTVTNVCYLPEIQNFLFILTDKSILSGIKSKNDLKMINLSSITNHTDMFLKLQIIYDYRKLFNNNNHIVFVDEPILLIKRFKSDNIMHVIHDDIFPIFMTYTHLCSGDVELCVNNIRLMFADVSNSNFDPYLEWYKTFSYKKPYDLNNLKTITCFKKLFVGLSRESVWFQYGFGIPQGPISSSSLNSAILDKFNSFILNTFNIEKSVLPSINNLYDINVVLLSRKNNRKILNEDFVVNSVLNICKLVYPGFNKNFKIHVLDPSQNTSFDILSTVTKSQILVGMHGSAMIYSLFLPEKAAIVEMFPFGIQPQYVSSTRALSQLPGMFFNYLSWRNFKEINTVTHPNRSPLLGGIINLPNDLQENIKNLKIIPAVKCCHDPAYLYRMFQDTIVDDSFEIIFRQALVNQKDMYEKDLNIYFIDYVKDNWFFPGPASNITCKIDKILGEVFINWNGPYNIVNDDDPTKLYVLYNTSVKIFSRMVSLETYSNKISIKLTAEELRLSIQYSDIQIWIKVIVDDSESIDVHSYCTF